MSESLTFTSIKEKYPNLEFFANYPDHIQKALALMSEQQEFQEALGQIEFHEASEWSVATPQLTTGFYVCPSDAYRKPRVYLDIVNREKLIYISQQRRGSLDAIAGILKVSSEQLLERPEVLQVFFLVHEIAHHLEFLEGRRQAGPDASINDLALLYTRNRARDVLELPLQEVPPAVSAYINGEQILESDGTVHDTWKACERLRLEQGIKTEEELIAYFKQHEYENDVAYRELPSEAYADDTAVRFIRNYANQLSFTLFS